MKVRKIGRLLLTIALCILLSGCRIRTTGSGKIPEEDSTNVSMNEPGAGSLPEGDEIEPDRTDEQKKNEDPGERTKENPMASRKEYDENAPAEIVPGTDRTIHGAGEGNGASREDENADEAATQLDDGADEPATMKVAADEAKETGVSEEGQEADSALRYFTTLLQERMGGLYECQRLNVYWESIADHVTIFRTSQEHRLILNAGAYDVSARLLEENLRVDDGWIRRKNPGIIVKVVDGSVLGAGVSSSDAAEKIYAELLRRDGWSEIDAVRNGRVMQISEELLETPYLQTVAMLMIARSANPSLMADVDIGKALEMMAEEATGHIPSGLYGYNGQGGL